MSLSVQVTEAYKCVNCAQLGQLGRLWKLLDNVSDVHSMQDYETCIYQPSLDIPKREQFFIFCQNEFRRCQSTGDFLCLLWSKTQRGSCHVVSLDISKNFKTESGHVSFINKLPWWDHQYINQLPEVATGFEDSLSNRSIIAVFHRCVLVQRAIIWYHKFLRNKF